MELHRNFCFCCSKEGKGNKQCSRCHVAVYCSKECQTKDWDAHKAYCKHWVYRKPADADSAADLQADPQASAVFHAALAAAQAKVYVQMTPRVAESFAKALQSHALPSCEAEERIWGLLGPPSSPGYQRLLRAYQRAFEYGDLTATKLMEALCAKPNAGKALTQLLRNTKMVYTGQDAIDTFEVLTLQYRSLLEGLAVVSEFDQWPLNA